MLVPAVPCDEPHDSEVFAVVELATRAGERYPGDDAIFDEAAMACAPDLERFVGVPADQTRYGMFLVHPNEASWGRGDREVICSVYDPGGKITGTLEDAGR